jgi:hypothetical protein
VQGQGLWVSDHVTTLVIFLLLRQSNR